VTAFDLSIVIVNWNVRDLLGACLDSIRANVPNPERIEVIVVDSGSTDGSPALLQTRYPWVQLLAQTQNIGFTIANNIGLAAAHGRHLMLLNPDTEVVGDALMQMIDYLDSHSDVGIVGPHTLNADGSTQSTKRRFPTFLTGVFESTWLQPFAPRGLLDRFYTNDIPAESIADVDWVQGSALMIRREVYAAIGGLDERIVMYSEETDWCKRTKNAGWQVVYLGSARIIHYGGKSTEQVTARSQIHFQQSKLYYFRKHHGVLVALILRGLLLLSYAQQTAAEAIKGLIGHKRALRRDRVRIYWQVIRALVTG
jgi:GT2 family glycosyltransferase